MIGPITARGQARPSDLLCVIGRHSALLAFLIHDTLGVTFSLFGCMLAQRSCIQLSRNPLHNSPLPNIRSSDGGYSVNAPSRRTKFLRSASSSTIRRFSMPRTITWCRVPGLLSLACLCIPFYPDIRSPYSTCPVSQQRPFRIPSPSGFPQPPSKVAD